MSTDSSIELNAEGTGPKVRTQKLTEPTVPDSSGNATADTVRHQQVVTLADDRGDISDPSGDILAALHAIRDVLERISFQLE